MKAHKKDKHSKKHHNDHQRSKHVKDEKITKHGKIGKQVRELDHHLKKKQYLTKSKDDRSNLVKLINDYYPNTGKINMAGEKSEILSEQEIKEYETGYDNLILIDKILNQQNMIQKLEKLPLQIAEIIASFIELLDLVKMPSVAEKSYVDNLLNELHERLGKLDYLDTKETIEEIKQWQNKIKPKFIDKLLFREKDKLSSTNCQRLENDISKWLDNFKIQLSSSDFEM